MRDHASATWQELVARHGRVAGKLAHPDGVPQHRPRAALLACSDARVPPSLVFDEEPGTLFVVRIAGNSATPDAIASLTFAVEQLGTDLVVVLGHTDCGAVASALADGAPAVLAPILTPIDEMLEACDRCDDPASAVVANVRRNVQRLERDRGPLGEAVRAGRVVVRGAVHDIVTGALLEVEPAPRAPAPSAPSAPKADRSITPTRHLTGRPS